MDNTILESQRLLLKPLSFDELANINSGKGISDTVIDMNAVSDFVRSAISKKMEKMKNVSEKLHAWFTYWLIIYKPNSRGIGFIGFKGLSKCGYPEVGYSISSVYRRRGLMTEALETLTDWAQLFPGARGLTARVLRTNTGSINVLKNCRFRLADSAEQEDIYTLEFR